MENNLPKGWISISPLAIAEKIRGVSYGKEDVFNENGNGRIPVLRANGIEDNKIKYDDIVYVSSDNVNSNQILKTGDVLIAMSSGSKNLVGKTAQFFGDNKVSFGAFCGVLRPNQNINPKYFGYYFQSKDYRNTISEVAAGTNINNLKNEHFESLRIPIPPLPEQQRIVAKLDELMAKIERSRARLERIPQILKRFRQSVLSTAVTGKGSDVLSDDVCSLIQIGPFGTQLHRHDYISNGIPIINPTHIQGGMIIPDFELTITKSKYKELENYHLIKGDVIMGRRGEMARCALINDKESGWLCGTGSLFFRPDQTKITPKYLYWLLTNSNTKEFLESESKGTTMSNLNLSIAKKIPVKLPSLREQIEVIKRVEQLYKVADKIEARYNKAKAQLDKLPQSLLAKAFRGELVPQDESDEPASALLERIQQGNPGKPGKARKPRSYKMGVEPLGMAAEQ